MMAPHLPAAAGLHWTQALHGISALSRLKRFSFAGIQQSRF